MRIVQMKKAVWQEYPFKNDVTNIEDRIWGKRGSN